MHANSFKFHTTPFGLFFFFFSFFGKMERVATVTAEMSSATMSVIDALVDGHPPAVNVVQVSHFDRVRTDDGSNTSLNDARSDERQPIATIYHQYIIVLEHMQVY
jgi:hypothetical protein